MTRKKRLKGVIVFDILLYCFIIMPAKGSLVPDVPEFFSGHNEKIENQNNFINQPSSFNKVVTSIQSLSLERNYSGLQNLADSLIITLGNQNRDSLFLSELYYYIGVCETITKNRDAIKWLKRTILLKEKLGLTDDHYIKSIYNMSLAYNFRGDLTQVTRYSQEYINLCTRIYGENSSEVALGYSILIGAASESHDYRKLPEYVFNVLGILSKNKEALTEMELSDLYQNIGVSYLKTGDFAKGRIYLEESEAIRNNLNMTLDEKYINLINSLAITYGYLGLNDKESEYFDKGVGLAVSNRSYFSFNLINTYVIMLGEAGKTEKGKILLSDVVEKSRALYGSDSRYYIEVLRNLAEYKMNYSKDYISSLKLFDECIGYLNSHKEDITLKTEIMGGYSEALFRSGEVLKALQAIQNLNYNNNPNPENNNNLFVNPPPDSLKIDTKTLRLLRLKHEILWSIYSGSGDFEALKSAAATSELIISLIDKIRMNISEDESRILLGDRYRESYLMAIHDFELCHRKTGDRKFLEKAFEFAERSKVAGLLAATRELNAIQLQIPGDIAEYENSLLKEISYYNSRIALENDKAFPDKNAVNELKSQLLSSIKARDSLMLTFERDYPGYYSIKYMNTVPSLKKIPSIIGRKNNYLNYVIADSLLYIFMANRRYQEIVSCKIDSGFLGKLREYRILLSDPDASFDARNKFARYQKISCELYRTLIEPVRKYFISKNLIISPDNILSYIPFETIISSQYSGEEIMYRNLNYLMNDFNISYNYSAAYMEETGRRKINKTKNLIAFAPIYTRYINTDSIFMKRQAGGGILYDLPYARQEAEYITDITGGQMYLNNEAKESVYKSEAGKYDIVHLAMHTYLNDQNPMNSAMIFAQCDDKDEDGLLYTYEIYGIPLNARMVVLSSCNTGNGTLSSGEGILSLARGFLYSGSRSVIMSMWEVEDKSGTEIIDLYYDYLKRGNSKSEALKKTRNKYLNSAKQIKSHPYFWSTLVIYGDDSPLYFPWRKLVIVFGSLLLILVLIIAYFRKPRYS